MRYFAYLLVAGLLAFGCGGPGMTVKVTKPAEINLAGVKKIAIGEIKGKGSAEVTEALVTALFNSNRFEVLDRQHLDKILKEQALSYTGVIDEETAVELGKLLGSAAMVFGRVAKHKFNQELTYEDYKDDKKKSHRRWTRKGTARVEMTLQVTDLRTGKIVAIKQLSDTKTDMATLADKKPGKINGDVLLQKARNVCINNFMKAIAPYTVTEHVALEKDKESPEILRGIEFAKTGDLQRAANSFRQAVEKNPDNPKSHYNLGVALMCLGDYNRAIASLDKAYGMAPSGKYASELKRCKKWQQDAERLRKQMNTISK